MATNASTATTWPPSSTSTARRRVGPCKQGLMASSRAQLQPAAGSSVPGPEFVPPLSFGGLLAGRVCVQGSASTTSGTSATAGCSAALATTCLTSRNSARPTSLPDPRRLAGPAAADGMRSLTNQSTETWCVQLALLHCLAELQQAVHAQMSPLRVAHDATLCPHCTAGWQGQDHSHLLRFCQGRLPARHRLSVFPRPEPHRKDSTGWTADTEDRGDLL